MSESTAALEQRLREFARSGLPALDDADEAAAHLGILITTLANERTLYGTAPSEQDVQLRIVTRGVHAFLHGYGTS